MKYMVWVLSSIFITASAQSQNYTSDQPIVEEWILDVSDRYGISIERLEGFVVEGEKRQDIIDLMSKPAEKTLSWKEYRAIFLDQKRVEGGVEFWRDNVDVLNDVSQKTGVPPEYVTAIIGVETRYGKIMGQHRVIDALTTLAFDYPKRASFFRVELEKFFLLTEQNGFDSAALLGSYAGAMGMAQFMPSSYMAYAVDYTGDNVIDIWHNPEDAIASVANYFEQHGWTAGGPVVSPVKVPLGAAFNRQLKLDQTAGALIDEGFLPWVSVNPNLPAKVFEFKGQEQSEYWMALPNFYTITRYNHSHYYAMVVYLLAQRIKTEYIARQ